ncbi:MAG TPA: ABC transporter permease [Bauldia sp.]|nr:ABC transporter permease [Bauldia sp.]
MTSTITPSEAPVTAASSVHEHAVRRYRQANWWTRVRLHPAGPVAIMFLGLLAACIVAGLLVPQQFAFLNPANLSLILKQIPNYGMVALGVGLLMIAGEFDLSVGSVFVVAPFAMATAYAAGIPLPVAILIGFSIAALIGLANGLITLNFGIPSFITTLGMLFIVRTSAPFIVGYARSLPFKPPEAFTEILTGDVNDVIALFAEVEQLPLGLGRIPMQFIWFIGFALLCYLILNRHFLGNHFFAAGGNPNAARFAGINVYRTKVFGFILSSVFAAAAGLFSITRLQTAMTNPQLFIELFAVAICVIGGLSLFGGRGSVIGIVLAAALLQLVQDVIILARLPGFYLDMFVGIMIVVGVVINQVVRRKY